MDLLCLMGLFPKEYKKEIERDSIYGIQNAADKLQWALVEGFSQIKEIKTTVLNSVYIGSFPKRYKKIKIPSFRFVCFENIEGINVGFCNLSVFKWFSRYFGIKKNIKQWALKPTSKQKVVLIYAMATPFVNIAKYIKDKYPHITVCIVVPDLPEYMRPEKAGTKSLYSLLKKIEIKAIKRMIKKVDCYVLLTKHMQGWFDRTITCTVVEGIATVDSNAINEENQIEKQKVVLYAGGIKKEYGVLELVKLFKKIDSNEWRLDIYGDGPDLIQIQELAKECNNIRVYGMVSNEDVLKAQREARILINPRRNQIFTKYSFPSKLLEYMSSGTPVLSYELDGIPAEYLQYFFHIPDKKDGLEIALSYVMSLSDDELDEKGREALEFVASYKNSKVQCKKIIDMFQELI